MTLSSSSTVTHIVCSVCLLYVFVNAQLTSSRPSLVRASRTCAATTSAVSIYRKQLQLPPPPADAWILLSFTLPAWYSCLTLTCVCVCVDCIAPVEKVLKDAKMGKDMYTPPRTLNAHQRLFPALCVMLTVMHLYSVLCVRVLHAMCMKLCSSVVLPVSRRYKS